jgi:membrane-anchored protein YejM (alkaline phosphatase superfamily)
VLVIVGDHGEELLAEGRLSHSGGVWEGQIRTPLLIHTPAYAPSRLTSVTSHANILPAVSAAVGVPVPVEAGERVLAPKGVAVAGHTNHTSKPSEWVLVRDPYKVLFGLDRHGRFVVTGVTDRRDHDVLSSQLMVDPAFLQTLAVMKGVEQLSLSPGAGLPQ